MYIFSNSCDDDDLYVYAQPSTWKIIVAFTMIVLNKFSINGWFATTIIGVGELNVLNNNAWEGSKGEYFLWRKVYWNESGQGTCIWEHSTNIGITTWELSLVMTWTFANVTMVVGSHETTWKRPFCNVVIIWFVTTKRNKSIAKERIQSHKGKPSTSHGLWRKIS